MFSKAALTFLLVGALSVNASIVPVARSPAPEPESQELAAWMLRRDLTYELLSREPEDWAEWAGFARDLYTAKREPSPWGTGSKVVQRAPEVTLHHPKPVNPQPVTNFIKTHNK